MGFTTLAFCRIPLGTARGTVVMPTVGPRKAMGECTGDDGIVVSFFYRWELEMEAIALALMAVLFLDEVVGFFGSQS